MSSPNPPGRGKRPSSFFIVAIIVAILLPLSCLGVAGLIFFICTKVIG